MYRDSVCDIGEYVLFSLEKKELAYTHATSPIRRIVDLLNQCMIHSIIDTLSDDGIRTISFWLFRLDFINKSMKSIRKVQNDCKLLHFFQHKHDISDTIYNAIVIEQNNSLNSYTIFVKEFNLFSKLKSNIHIQLFSNINVRFFYFGLQSDKRTKIRSVLA